MVPPAAGLPERMHLRDTPAIWSFAVFGDTTGESDEYGLPVRRDWAADYRGFARVVYGHTPARAHGWKNNTLCLDTGCAFGGALPALRSPDLEVVSVPAHREYAVPKRPLG